MEAFMHYTLSLVNLMTQYASHLNNQSNFKNLNETQRVCSEDIQYRIGIVTYIDAWLEVT